MNGMSNGSLLLEEKVLNAVKRMRCSRRSGVIFLAMITAIAWPTPHHRLRRSLSSRRSLLVSASANYRHPPCLIIKPPWQRTAQLDAGRAQHDRRGNIQGDGWRLRRSGHANFPCHGVARATPSFIQSAFTSTAQPSLVLSWAPRKYRPPALPSLRRPLVPPPAELAMF